MLWRGLGTIYTLVLLLIFSNLPLVGFGLMSTIEAAVSPLKHQLTIGILANRGAMVDYAEYETMAKALSQKSSYEYKILPITFDKITTAIKEDRIDFLITNPSLYVELEHQYGIMRIATLEDSHHDDFAMPKFGGVLFTSSKNNSIKTVNDIIDTNIIAVDKNSFGGYVSLWYELLLEHDIDISKHAIFEGTHDKVVRRILANPHEVGIVRSDIIERMVSEGVLKHDDVRVIRPKIHPNFPFLLSTNLYPEWAFATLSTTPLSLTEETLIGLLTLDKAESSLLWTFPLDYGDIHEVHKYLGLPPYDIPFSLGDFVKRYNYQIFVALLMLLFTLSLLVKLFFTNQKYNHINIHLNKIVDEKTRALTEANKALKSMVDTDELTKIASRRYFYTNSNNYLQLSLRNNKSLFLLSLDIDHFKKVNDTYGHHIGDKVLVFFCKNVSQCLRKSDIFGRVGGEEFGICILDATFKGALELAEKIRYIIESSPYKNNKISINLSVSIGIARSEQSDATIENIIYRADKALYKAKKNGRNRIEVWTKP